MRNQRYLRRKHVRRLTTGFVALALLVSGGAVFVGQHGRQVAPGAKMAFCYNSQGALEAQYSGLAPRDCRWPWDRQVLVDVPPQPTVPTTVPASTTPTTVTPTTVTPTTKPTTSTSGPVGAGLPPVAGYFDFSTPGSTFRSDAQCAALVHRSTWEPRPQNNVANHTAPTNPAALANFSQWSTAWNANYKPRIDGNFQGTTDEIIQWAACKWGWSDNLIRAEAIVESSWRQSTAGDGGNSFGLLQIKWNFHPAGPAKGAVGSSWPNSANSTAYAVDQQVAEMRGCYDGMSTYLGNTKGNVAGCLGSWFSGSWDPTGGSYYSQVAKNLTSEPWLKAGF